MTGKTSITINGPVSRPVVLGHLQGDESGFNLNANQGYDFRKPLRSDVGDVINCIGIVVNTAQLAATLYQIYREKKVAKTGEVEAQRIEITITTNGETLVVVEGTKEQIESQLKVSFAGGN